MDMVPPEWIIGGCIGVLTLAGLYFIFAKEKYPYTARKTLLTKTELRFYKTLSQICTQYFSNLGIAMQVRLADIINCSDQDWHKGYGPKISAKHIDFVLFEKNTTEICLCIELDDTSHERPDRKRRDVFVNKAMAAANVSLLRISTKNMENKKFILEQIQKLN